MKEGWEYKKLGDITEIKGGKRLPKGVKLLTTPTEHPYIRVADFNDFGTVDTDDIHYISDSVYEQIKRYIIKKEDVYISIAGTIGKSGIIPDYLDGANLTENACRLILSSNVCQRYVYYFTISPSFIKQIDERTKKSAQPKLALTRLSDVIITYPTIKEQQSIVDYLDSAFAKIDALKANAEKALNEAKALFQASLKEMLEPKEGWEEKTLEEIAQIKIGPFGSLLHKSDYILGGVPLVNPIHMVNGHIAIDNNYTISESKAKELSSYRLKENDIVFARRGEIGRCALVGKNEDTYLCGTGSLLVRFNQEVDYGFMLLLFQSKYCKEYLEKQATGATMLNINSAIVGNMTIKYPHIDIQQSIVATLDSLKSKVDRLQENYDKISQECDALKQAILRQVFE